MKVFIKRYLRPDAEARWGVFCNKDNEDYILTSSVNYRTARSERLGYETFLRLDPKQRLDTKIIITKTHFQTIDARIFEWVK